MKKVVSNITNRPRGRPRTGIQPALSARVREEVFERVDQWAEANGYTRSVAVATLIEHGLDAVEKAAGRRAKRKEKPP